MINHRIKFILLGCIFLSASAKAEGPAIRLRSPEYTLSHMPFRITMDAVTGSGRRDVRCDAILPVRGLRIVGSDSLLPVLRFEEGEAVTPPVTWANDKGWFEVFLDGRWTVVNVHTLPAWISVLPPLVAILSAVLLRQVLISLFAGIWLGATCIHAWNPAAGLLRVLDHYFVEAVHSTEHIAIILFTLMLGGMAGVITRSGGTDAIVRMLSRGTVSRKRGQVSAWLMGLVIFFDDYANTLIVGTTLRPIMDRYRISREKLSFIVDATAAPVTSLAVFSTWIGFELGLIQDAFGSLRLDWNVYWTYIETIPFRFYSLWMIALVVLIAVTGRDFGPMRKAELRASALQPDPVRTEQNERNLKKGLIFNALLPVIAVILFTFIGLWRSGARALQEQGLSDFGLREILGASDPFFVLIWSSFGGVVLAGLMAVCRKALSVGQVMDAFMDGLKEMLTAVVILVGAWSIGRICMDLHTAEFILDVTRGLLHPALLPAVVFLIAAMISFSTGTSWGTLSILIPIIVPVAWRLTLDADYPLHRQHGLLIGSLASVLSGSVFGDHCSPISDTTILSSMASGVDHIEHVRTQIPYALLTALIALAVGYIPAGFGLPPLVLIPVGLLLLGLVFIRISRPVH